MKSVCVYCGSSSGANPAHVEEAVNLGKELARRKWRLVYGAGNVGLMGALANSVLKHGGEVVGVIPRFMVEREWAHRGLSKLHVVDSMHERKAMMADLADSFLALPGGLGTLEELAECFTWIQLGYLRKPAALLNVGGYYHPLLNMLDHMLEEKFIRPTDRSLVFATDSIPMALDYLSSASGQIPHQDFNKRLV